MVRVAGRTKYGKKKIRERKKDKMDLKDKLREKFLNLKVELEKKHNSDIAINYKDYTFSQSGLSDEFKTNIGEIDRCMMLLRDEGIVSNKFGRHSHYTLYFERQERQKPEESVFEPLLDFKDCPICNSPLKEKSLKYSEGKKLSCNSNCFTYDAHYGLEIISVFERKWSFNIDDHRSIRGNNRSTILKEIKYWKKNERYVAKILLGDD